MSNKELQARVNPIFTTGKGTASSLAHAGNKDAVAIVSKMDLSEIKSGAIKAHPLMLKGFSTSLEARYEISNQLILRENKPNIIDLPSGYTPRALFAAKKGFNYIGLDLPLVADEIGGIVKGLIPDKYGSSVMYYGVDATNYESLSKALENISGEVCIVTDGLLGYFTEPEIVSVLNNMNRILSRFGGSWITGDMTNTAIYMATFGVLFKDDPAAVSSFTENAANKMSDATLGHNSLFDGGEKKAEAFLNEHGFSLEKISFADLLPELVSLSGDSNALQGLREAYRGLDMWRLTLKKGEHTKTKDAMDEENVEFNASISVKDKELSIELSGRLDTITAPELLEKYEAAAGDKKFTSITINAEKLQYISSAGLRVLMIMHKELEQDKGFHMVNVSREVREILEVTGFDVFLLQ